MHNKGHIYGRGGSIKTILSLLPYLWPKGEIKLKVRVILALIFLVLAKVAIVFVPFFYKDAINILAGEETKVTLPVAIILAYGVARISSLVFSELRDAVFAAVGQRAIRTIALQVFKHLHHLSLQFHLSRQTGGLSRAMERGTRSIQTLLMYSLFNIIPTLVEITLVFVILWQTLGLLVSGITIITVFLYVSFTLLITEWRTKFRREMNKQDSEANTKAIDSLLNYETVKYFNNDEHEAKRYDFALRKYESAAVKSQTSLASLNIGQSFIITLGLISVMLITGQGIVAGTLTLGTFVMANTYLMQLYQPLGFFGWVYREVKQSLIDMEAMFKLLTENVAVAEKIDAKLLEISHGNVQFDNVNFYYDERRNIIKDLTFCVNEGESIAIVGPTGSGKSTISRLLFRFYDVGSGKISIDGQDIREVTLDSLRAAIGVVPQDTVLFNESIYYNIGYGRNGSNSSEIESAAKAAHIHEFILSLPDGYNTVVGERGLKLSGGEKQRIAIARTILKNPKILIFDEASSALDTNTERQIQTNLDNLSQGRTTIFIAHRLSTIIHVNNIIVLDEGRIIEQGDHNSLLSKNGSYVKMWDRQQKSSMNIVR